MQLFTVKIIQKEISFELFTMPYSRHIKEVRSTDYQILAHNFSSLVVLIKTYINSNIEMKLIYENKLKALLLSQSFNKFKRYSKTNARRKSALTHTQFVISIVILLNFIVHMTPSGNKMVWFVSPLSRDTPFNVKLHCAKSICCLLSRNTMMCHFFLSY